MLLECKTKSELGGSNRHTDSRSVGLDDLERSVFMIYILKYCSSQKAMLSGGAIAYPYYGGIMVPPHRPINPAGV